MNRGPAVQANTFFLSNVSPQTPNLNRGMWRWLEERVRAWAVKHGEVTVISGSVFLGNRRTLASGRVGIPREYYKIVIRSDEEGDLQPLAFLFINGTRLPVPPGTMGVARRRITAAQADDYLAERLTRVAAITRLTGLDFFAELPSARKEALERAVGSALWPRN